MASLSSLLEKSLGIAPAVQIKIINSAIVVLLLILLRIFVIKIVWRKTEDVRLRYIWGKTLSYTVSILGLLLLSNIWFQGLHNLGTFFGLLSAGLALTLKDPVVNMAGWLFIIIRRPFTIGDRVQVGNFAGDVIDIRVFQFTLLEIGNWVNAEQSTGRIIHIPNGQVFTLPLANYTKGFEYIWSEIPVVITFESDWHKAKDILLNIASIHSEHLTGRVENKVREASKKFMIAYTKLTPVVYTAVKENGIQLTIRYICEPRNRRPTDELIWEDILEQFAKEKDIDFAYPTTRFYDNRTEGKKVTR